MILNDIREKQQKYRNENNVYFRKFCFLGLTHIFFVVGGGFLFLYVEDCYDPTPPVKTNITRKYQVICSEIRELSNQSVATDHDVLFQQRLSNLTILCNQDDQVIDDKQSCIFDQYAVTKWVSFVLSICFTIGESLFTVDC